MLAVVVNAPVVVVVVVAIVENAERAGVVVERKMKRGNDSERAKDGKLVSATPDWGIALPL